MINFNIYLSNNFNDSIYNINDNITNYSYNKPNIKFNIGKWNDLENKYYLVDLIFPEFKLNHENLNKNNKLIQQNVWNSLSSRPFKICPCNYEKLLHWSNNSILNICVFNDTQVIIGFCVVSLKDNFYFIDILCTNINQGIGTLIVEFIKNNFNDMPIKLKFTSNSKNFYLKKGFVLHHLYSDIMIWNNKKIEL